MYIDLKGENYPKPSIYYFDSVGDRPPSNVDKLINKIRMDTLKQNNIKLNYLYNDMQHQNGNNECGFYCLHFIIYMLKGGNFEKYINNKKNDKFMHKFRYLFFNK